MSLISAPVAAGYGNTAPGAPLDNGTGSDGETAEVENEAVSVVFGASTTKTTAAVAKAPWEHDMAFSQRFIEHLATLKI